MFKVIQEIQAEKETTQITSPWDHHTSTEFTGIVMFIRSKCILVNRYAVIPYLHTEI